MRGFMNHSNEGKIKKIEKEKRTGEKEGRCY